MKNLDTNGNYLFPKIFGNEEETGLMIFDGEWEQPNHLAVNLSKYIPSDITFATGKDKRMFLSNGGLMYVGGAVQSYTNDNIERATPECISPKQTATYIEANEIALTGLLTTYVTAIAQEGGGTVIARVQRRVVDSYGNRKGCHDNFSILRTGAFAKNKDMQTALTGFIATRSFITGAGYVDIHNITDDGQPSYRFAQKIDGLSAEEGYGYIGTMYRVVSGRSTDWLGDSTGARLEVRSNDINISPWAIQMRLGGMALLLAAAQTPLAYKIAAIPFAESAINTAKHFNRFTMDTDGNLEFPSEVYHSLDYQETIIDLFLGELEMYTEVPLAYYHIASELKDYCEDMRKVLAKELSLDALADRSDFAAKFSIISKYIQDRNAYKQDTSPDQIALQDLLYDYIGITAHESGKVENKIGHGYKLRNSGVFKDSISKNIVQRAYFTPPAETRAHIRGNLIKNYYIADVDWNTVAIPSSDIVEVDLDNPHKNQIDETTIKRLQGAFKRQKQ